MGMKRLPAHIRRLIPRPDSRPKPKAKPADTARRDVLQANGVDSYLELILKNRLERARLPLGESQFYFVPGRLHRFDRAWPDHMVAVEVQGGVWSDEGHGRKSMVAKDCAKLALAAALGWRVLPVTKDMIQSGLAIELIAQALEARHG